MKLANLTTKQNSPQGELEDLYNQFNNQSCSYPSHKTVPQILGTITASNSDSIAVTHGEEKLSYRDLDRLSNGIGNFLIKKSLPANSVIAILMNKSVDTIAAIIGILKAGHIYLPLHPEDPQARHEHMITESQVQFIFSQKTFIDIVDNLIWSCTSLTGCCYLDVTSTNEFESNAGNLSNRELWECVGEEATDDITGGGWTDSYTGRPITRSAMDEYGDNALQKLTPYLTESSRVFEIGFASGITMFRIAPMVASYVGTDISSAAVSFSNRKARTLANNNIKLYRSAAIDTATIDEDEFDLIIINSVLQCFGSHRHFELVLQQAINKLGDSGQIFLGDIMDSDLKDQLLDSLHQYKRKHPDANTKLEFAAELFLSRAYLDYLPNIFPEIVEVHHSTKIGNEQCELTDFRFDTILTVNKCVQNTSSSNNIRQTRTDFIAHMDTPCSPLMDTSSSQLAYIMYTSGSTGKPKGVAVTHRGISRLVCNNNYADISSKDIFIQANPLGFDASTFSIFGALLNGAQVSLLEKEKLLNYQELKSHIEQHKITTGFFTASVFNQYVDIDPKLFKDFRLLLVGGEALSASHVQKFRQSCPDVRLVNGYGPTENTTFSLTFEIDRSYDRIPIGKPIANSAAWVMNDQLELQPVGISGELYLSGDGLAQGYIAQPELTEQSFMDNPYRPGEKMYKTGDRARLNHEGVIEFLGRKDHQLKIRGNRVELEEIENMIKSFPLVEKVVVDVRRQEDQSEQLIAWISGNTALDTNDIMIHLNKHLPIYMIPDHLVIVSEFPINENGKLNSAALPNPVNRRKTPVVPPENDIQLEMVKAFKDVLNLDEVGIQDNFYWLGGDSIKAILVSSRLYQQGLKLQLQDLFRHPTIAGVTPFVSINKQEDFQGIVEGKVQLSPIQIQFFETGHPKESHWNQSIMLFRPEGFDVDRTSACLKKIVEHHDALRLTFRRDNHEINAYNRNADGILFELEHHQVQHDDKLIQIATDAQMSIRLDQGPLLKVHIFSMDDGDHLLLTAHHLVIDGVSLRIILEDLAALYTSNPEAHQLPAKTTSWKAWTQGMHQYALDGISRLEENYWKSLISKKYDLLPQLENNNRSTIGDTTEIRFTCSQFETTSLLSSSHRAYNTESNDLLIAALGIAISEAFDVNQTLIHLEGHGREQIDPTLNVDRTVGWFTTIFPYCLENRPNHDLGTHIKATKESIRQIPNKGIGFGIARYLGSENKAHQALEDHAELCFNFMGDFSSSLQNAPFQLSSKPVGQLFNPANYRKYKLMINAVMVNGCLEFVLDFDPKILNVQQVSHFADRIKSNLLAIVTHCNSIDRPESTPSDYGTTELSSKDLQTILEGFAPN